MWILKPFFGRNLVNLCLGCPFFVEVLGVFSLFLLQLGIVGVEQRITPLWHAVQAMVSRL